jgi:hypothetical protein
MNDATSTRVSGEHAGDEAGAGMKSKLLGAWLFVGVPLTYGIVQTVRRATALFTG